MEKLTFYKIAIIVLIILNIGMLSFIYLNQPQKQLSLKPPQTNDKVQEREQPPNANVNEFIVKELNLNKKQEETFIQLSEKHHEKEVNLHDSLRIVKHDFFDLLSSDNTEKGDVYAHYIGNIEKERVLNTFRYFKEVRKLCDAEQKEQLDRIIKDVLRMMAGPPKQ